MAAQTLTSVYDHLFGFVQSRTHLRDGNDLDDSRSSDDQRPGFEDFSRLGQARQQEVKVHQTGVRLPEVDDASCAAVIQ